MTGARLANRVLAALAALALLVAGLVAAAEIVVAALDRPPVVVTHDAWYRAGLGNSWDDVGPRLVCAALVATGALLLLSQLVPRRPDELVLAERPGTPPATLTRRGLERSVDQAVRALDGVAGARVRCGRRGVRVEAQTNRRRPGELQHRVQEAGEARLGVLGLDRGTGLDATVRPREPGR